MPIAGGRAGACGAWNKPPATALFLHHTIPISATASGQREGSRPPLASPHKWSYRVDQGYQAGPTGSKTGPKRSSRGRSSRRSKAKRRWRSTSHPPMRSAKRTARLRALRLARDAAGPHRLPPASERAIVRRRQPSSKRRRLYELTTRPVRPGDPIAAGCGSRPRDARSMLHIGFDGLGVRRLITGRPALRRRSISFSMASHSRFQS